MRFFLSLAIIAMTAAPVWAQSSMGAMQNAAGQAATQGAKANSDAIKRQSDAATASAQKDAEAKEAAAKEKAAAEAAKQLPQPKPAY